MSFITQSSQVLIEYSIELFPYNFILKDWIYLRYNLLTGTIPNNRGNMKHLDKPAGNS